MPPISDPAVSPSLGSPGSSYCQRAAPTTIVAPSSDTDKPAPNSTPPNPVPASSGALFRPGVNVAAGVLVSAQPPAGLLNTYTRPAAATPETLSRFAATTIMSPTTSTSQPNPPPATALGESSRANCRPLSASNTYAAPGPSLQPEPVIPEAIDVERSPNHDPTTITSSSASTETPNQSLADPSSAVIDRACTQECSRGRRPDEVT